jgi:hypothetical protein
VSAVDLRHEAIVLETDRYRIEGNLTLPREGYRSRLSDYVNQRDREFFAVSEATLTALDSPDQVRHAEFLMVARRHVRMVTLASEESLGPDDARAGEPRATKRTTGSATRRAAGRAGTS